MADGSLRDSTLELTDHTLGGNADDKACCG
jgi:hypothetical protein